MLGFIIFILFYFILVFMLSLGLGSILMACMVRCNYNTYNTTDDNKCCLSAPCNNNSGFGLSRNKCDLIQCFLGGFLFLFLKYCSCHNSLGLLHILCKLCTYFAWPVTWVFVHGIGITRVRNTWNTRQSLRERNCIYIYIYAYIAPMSNNNT